VNARVRAFGAFGDFLGRGRRNRRLRSVRDLLGDGEGGCTEG